MQLVPGTLVTPNVRLRRPLREGGMGHVWLAEHLTLRLDVAVKFISGKLATDDPQVLARFEQEARTAARIKSDHVVQTHDCGIMPDGTPYIVMELLEGESLQDHLDRVGVLSLRDLGRVVAQVAKALGRAHKIGVVHRDIKPANIFLCATDEGLQVKVLDFGVAQPAPPSPSPAEATVPIVDGQPIGTPELMVGTLPFLSPEQFAGQAPVDPSADVWALGVVAYRCLTGRFPFTGETPGLLCVSVMSGELPRPSALRSGLPVGLDEWFGRVLHRAPSQRFGSAKEMAHALARVLPSTAEELDEDHSTIAFPYAAPSSPGSSPGQAGMLESGPSLVLPSPAPPLGRVRWAQPLAVVGAVTAVLVLGAAALVLLRTPAASPDGSPAARGAATTERSQAAGAAAERADDGSEAALLDAGSEEPSASAQLSPFFGDAGPSAAPQSSGLRPGQAGPRKRRRPGREDYGF
jgi:serine/threonine protein kinase